MTLRRWCYALSLVASGAAILGELEDAGRPVLWLAVAVALVALVGSVEG